MRISDWSSDVCSSDLIYPTLAALAALPAPTGPQPIDGTSLAPVLHDPAARVRGYAYHAYPRPGRLGQAIRTERYRLVRWTQEKTGARDYELYRSEEQPSELQSLMRITYAVFCLKKKK